MTTHYAFSVTEIRDDERILITTYIRIGKHIHLVMTLYDDMTLQSGETLIDVQMINGHS